MGDYDWLIDAYRNISDRERDSYESEPIESEPLQEPISPHPYENLTQPEILKDLRRTWIDNPNVKWFESDLEKAGLEPNKHLFYRDYLSHLTAQELRNSYDKYKVGGIPAMIEYVRDIEFEYDDSLYGPEQESSNDFADEWVLKNGAKEWQISKEGDKIERPFSAYFVPVYSKSFHCAYVNTQVPGAYAIMVPDIMTVEWDLTLVLWQKQPGTYKNRYVVIVPKSSYVEMAWDVVKGLWSTAARNRRILNFLDDLYSDKNYRRRNTVRDNAAQSQLTPFVFRYAIWPNNTFPWNDIQLRTLKKPTTDYDSLIDKPNTYYPSRD